jgi:hypothetical protein
MIILLFLSLFLRGSWSSQVDVNAQQYHLTGVVLVCGDVTMLVVEGGPKAIKKVLIDEWIILQKSTNLGHTLSSCHML